MTTSRDREDMAGGPVGTVMELAPEVPVTTDIERRAIAWISPYSQSRHLIRARDWLVYLDHSAPLEARLAVVTHDIERMFPNGPTIDKATCRWDDPHYLYAHASRSAEIVGVWLHSQAAADRPAVAHLAVTDVAHHRLKQLHSQDGATDELSLSEVQRLITLHEFGGIDGADLVQAADSLSFLETLQDVVRGWVTGGECDVRQARAKHRYMAERIRLSAAKRYAEPLLEQALASLEDLQG
jgi:hypothetical protein